MANVNYPTVQTLAPDGVTNTFTLTSTPDTDSLLLIWNGIVQKAGSDYTLAGQIVTMTLVPGATDALLAYYTAAPPSPTFSGSSGGIRFDPEVVSLALFILLGQAQFTFQSMDRKGKIWSNVNITDQPYFALIERGGEVVQNQAIGLTKHTLHFLVLVYIRADADQSPSAPVPATQLNAAWKAIEGIMNSVPLGERQTLGGIVNNAWINGPVMIDTGILDEQCALMIPIDVEVGV
jgi:hypothetical protein